jgi:hypothetical protein
MWKCDCGEFNNDDLEFCVSCAMVRVADPTSHRTRKKQLSSRAMFRRIQDFLLFDIAFCSMVALYCFVADDIAHILPVQQFPNVEVPAVLKTTLPIIAIILFQVLLAVNVLRMLYSTALNSERNSLFLRQIYHMLKEKEDKEKPGEGS